MTARDRADCLGILWLHTEDDSRASGCATPKPRRGHPRHLR
jgi:hypothetical protein